jgi:hypothetical protein
MTRRPPIARRALLAAGALLVLAVSAAPAAAQAPAGDAVTGSGTARFISGGLEGFTTSFQVDLRAGPSGENPTGTLTLLLTFTDPTCFVIRTTPVEEPPTATVNLLNPVTGLRVVAQFGDAPGGQLIAVSSAEGPDDCTLGSSPTVAQVIDGQFRIVDALPLPSSASQCRNGGWRSFAARFKNQGQCVAFVQRGPNP